MYQFHITVRARPAGARPGEPAEVAGCKLETLSVQPPMLAQPLELTFEQAAANLQRIERLDFEPDGYFLWLAAPGETPWQVDGHLYDRYDRLLMVNLKGRCPPEEFDRLLAAFGWPGVSLMFELVQEALYVDEEQFRRYAGRT